MSELPDRPGILGGGAASERLASLADPLDFVVEALAGRGALVERDPAGALAVVPEEVARALGIAEEARLSMEMGSPGFCGLGSPLLERIVEAARETVPVASLRLGQDPPRRAQAIEAAERLIVRNGLSDLVDVGTGQVTYVAATFRWVAEADDRYEGLLTVIGEAESGGAPDPGFAALLTAERLPLYVLSRATPLAAPLAARAAAWLPRRATWQAGKALATIRESVARRRLREQGRIDDYFAALGAEARSPRRAIDAKAIAARVAALDAEHQAKLQALEERYAMRVRFTPAAILCVETRVAAPVLRLRRRKEERSLTVRVPPGARLPDELACEACAATTLRILLCDDRLHILCEACAPSAQGRPRCPACAGRKS